MFRVNVLSLFDGKSSGYTALELAGVPVANYYSSEVDKYAIQVSNAIHPNQVRLGDVLGWHFWNIDWASIDLVLGGFPCQAWSMAGKQLGDKDERGALFWTMLDIMQYVLHHNPKAKFLIENVKMKKEFEEYITFHTEQALGHVEKHLINSALVSAQNRQRYYWTNIKDIEQPNDKGLLLADVIEHGVVDQDKSYCIDANYWKGGNLKSYFEKHRRQLVFNEVKTNCLRARANNESLNEKGYERFINKRVGTFVHNPVRTSERGRRLTPDGTKRDDKNGIVVRGYEVSTDGKTCALTTVQKDNYITENFTIRKLTPRECFRLQTVPEHYIDKILACGVSNTQLYKIAGNGWTDEVIAHIFSYIKQSPNS